VLPVLNVLIVIKCALCSDVALNYGIGFVILDMS